MQEIAIILGSLAGVATAAAAIRIAPKGNGAPDGPQTTGESRYLEIEREILTKTIARLYEADTGLTKGQRDGLLIKYQHRLEIIQLKIQRLKHTGSSKETDEGVGNLMIRMDEKLSKLDERIHELSSSMAETRERLLQETWARRQIQEEHSPSEPATVTAPGVPARIPVETSAGIPAAAAAAAAAATTTSLPEAPAGIPAGIPAAAAAAAAATTTSLPEAPVVIPAGTDDDAKTDDPARAGSISRWVQPHPRGQEIRPLPEPKKIDAEVAEPRKEQAAATAAAALTESSRKSMTEANTVKPEDDAADKAKPDTPLASQTNIPELEEPGDDIDDAEELKKIKDDINKALTKLAQTEVE